MPAPIALFAFNRPNHLQRTLIALAANELAAQSDLTVFCDGPRTEKEVLLTDAVREVARNANGFASIRVLPRDVNMGCAGSVIAGLNEMFRLHEWVVVLEDDVVSSPYMLRYLNAGLERYADSKTVFNISAFSHPAIWVPIPDSYPFDVYFLPRFTCSGGWASWRDRWELADWSVPDYDEFAATQTLRRAFGQAGMDAPNLLDAQMRGELDSWAIRFDYARFIHGGLGVNPVFSYTTNIGVNSGTHTTFHTTRFDNDITLALQSPVFPNYIFADRDIVDSYLKASEPLSFFVRAINKLWRVLTAKNYFTV